MSNAGSINVKWTADKAKFMRDMQKARGELQESMKSTVALGKSMRKTGAIMTAAGGAIVGVAGKMVSSWANAGDEIHKAGLRTGFSADALSRWRVVAQRSGTDLKAVETGVKRMQRSIVQLGDGLAESTRSFDRLGLSLEDIQGLKPEDQMQLIMERMADIEDPTIRAATAQEIFGRAGTQLLPVLEDGAEGLAELMKVAEETGEVFTEEGAKSAAEYQDAMRDMKGSIQGVVRTLAVELAPVFQDIIEWVTNAMVRFREFAERNQALVGIISRVVVVFGALLAALGPVVMVFGQFLVMAPKIIIGIKSIGVAMNASLGIYAAVAVGILAIVSAYDKLNSAVSDAEEATKRHLDMQKEQEKTLSAGREALKKYGDASVESLKKQEVGYEEAKTAANAFRQYESMMMQQGEKEAAENWRKRAQMYQEYADNHAERLEENTENELETERTKNESLLEEYGIKIEELGDLDDIRLEDFGEHAAEIKDIISKMKDFDDDYVEHTGDTNEKLSAEQKRFIDGQLGAMGQLVEGNEKAAISGAISTIFNMLPWPASTVAAKLAKPLISRMIPSFADGGIVSGPTIGLMGEYPGVKSNPEVIAPLDKLQGMVGGGGNVEVNVNIDKLSPESVNETLYRLTQGIKQRVPEAIEFSKRNGELYSQEAGKS